MTEPGTSQSSIDQSQPQPKTPSGQKAPAYSVNNLGRIRGVLKGRVTRFQTYVESFVGQTLTPEQKAEIKLRTQGATTLLYDFNTVQSQIEELSDNIDEHLDYRDIVEATYYSAMAKAQGMISDGKVSDGPTNSNHAVKLPTISLPSFDGRYESWLEFKDTYLSLVHNSTQISSIQKFHYLKSSLVGSAALVIDSLEFSAQNYDIAWELLTTRYDNNRLLVHNHVKALFSIQPMTKESPELLRKLVDTILKNLRALKTLGEPTQHWDTLIIYIVVSKLDTTTEREWEQYKGSQNAGDSKSKLRVEDLLAFLGRRADMLETLLVTHLKAHNNGKQMSHSQVPSVKSNNISTKVHCNVSSTSTANKQPQGKFTHKPCPMCQGSHPVYACQSFLDLSISEKYDVITRNKMCTNCLRFGHELNDCRFGPCKKCSKKHNSLLHREESNGGTQNNTVALFTLGKESQFTSSSALHSHNHTSHHNALSTQVPDVEPVLLSTAVIEIADIHNNYLRARALLDSASQRCFITQSLCKKLHTPVIQSTHNIKGVGSSVTQCTQTCNVKIRSLSSSYTTQIQCLVLPTITSNLPSQSIAGNCIRIPNHIQLADPQYFESQPIDVLIGADLFWDLLEEGKIRLPNGPYLQNTKVGWIISGPIYTHSSRSKSLQVQCNFTQTLDTQLRKFWELEELTGPIHTRSNDEKACEEHFIKTTTRTHDGRFCVQYPFKESPDTLGESFPQAEKRFLALERRLDRTPAYKEMHTQFAKEYIALGHMSPVDTYKTPHYVIPYHGIFKEHRESTKLRLVYDASCKTTTGKSLNDLQLVGEAIQGDLLAILLRFRQHRYVACADIEKMYRQVLN